MKHFSCRCCEKGCCNGWVQPRLLPIPGSARWSSRRQPGWGAGRKGWCRWPRVGRASRPPTPASRRGHRTENRRRMAKDAPGCSSCRAGRPAGPARRPPYPRPGGVARRLFSRCEMVCFFRARLGLARAGLRLRATHRRRGALHCRRNGRRSLRCTLTEVPVIPENGCGLAKSGFGENCAILPESRSKPLHSL